MAAPKYNEFELVVMLMESLHEAGMKEPVLVKPDIVDFIYDLPDVL